MPLIELNRAGEQSYVHLTAMLPSAGCPDMHHGRRRREMDLPAGSCYAISKVSILKVHEVGWVETTYSIECCADCQCHALVLQRPILLKTASGMVLMIVMIQRRRRPGIYTE